MDASYAFVPWLRRGVATAITRAEGQAGTKPRAEIPVTLTFDPGALTATATLSLLGAGEVTGIDPRTVIRVWPRAGVYDASANYFPLLELDQPDLPWRYTPARPDGKGRLRPWIALIALTGDEYELTEPDATHPLPVVKVLPATPLPNLKQTWAWAHVHVTGASPQDAKNATKLRQFVADRLEQDPKSVIARLLCPRRLRPRTAYTAFLVPTFRRGALAGRGEPVPETVDALEEAWAAAATQPQPVELPVYYSWEFVTGEAADFEELVRRLNKTSIQDAGKRDMDVSEPGLGLPTATAAQKPLGLEGALRAPGLAPSQWDPATERDPWIAALKKLVETPAELTTSAGAARRLAPPLYGRWHAGRSMLGTVPRPRTRTPWYWFDELNSDPRLRVAAAVGAYVVQSQQDQLMASAWRQVAGIRELNAELRHAQAAREIARRVHARHIATADLEVALQMTEPLHARVRETATAGAATVEAQFRTSPIRPGVLAPQRRRVWRRMGPVARRQGRLAEREPQPPSLLVRLNSGQLRIAPPPRAPDSIADLSRLDLRPRVPLSAAPGGADAYRPVEFAPDDVDTWFDAAGPGPAPDPGGGGEGGKRFREAVAAAWDVLQAAEPPPIPLQPVDLRTLRKRLVDALDPQTTIEAFYENARAKLTADFAQTWKPEDKLEPIMAAPTFPNPMFEPLRELSQEWIFPGLDKVPANTMSLLETNPRFISAYMVGLNHEMSRELLWHGYPTDQRGTYFKQFWDPSAYYPKPGQTLDPTQLEDIDAITAWPPPGDKASSIDLAGKKSEPADRLVLLLRGDLLARYPSLVLYAAPAKLKPTDAGHPTRDPQKPEDRTLDTDLANEEQPLFGGTLKPDVSFFAFAIPKAKALASATDPGYFFVLQEQDSEARFGLDVDASTLNSWDNLAWPDVNVAVGRYIDLTTNKANNPTDPGPATWPEPADATSTGTAADLAYITLQRRVRVAVHASDMILP
jgi:hypothetical protein